MRVPDLDWPAELFTDVATTRLDSLARPARPAPGLWRDMLNAWTRDAVPSWCSPSPAHEQIAL